MGVWGGQAERASGANSLSRSRLDMRLGSKEVGGSACREQAYGGHPGELRSESIHEHLLEVRLWGKTRSPQWSKETGSTLQARRRGTESKVQTTMIRH